MCQRQFGYAPSLLEEVCTLHPKDGLSSLSDHRSECLVDLLWGIDGSHFEKLEFHTERSGGRFDFPDHAVTQLMVGRHEDPDAGQ